jgi:hypothetical protein
MEKLSRKIVWAVLIFAVGCVPVQASAQPESTSSNLKPIAAENFTDPFIYCDTVEAID